MQLQHTPFCWSLPSITFTVKSISGNYTKDLYPPKCVTWCWYLQRLYNINDRWMYMEQWFIETDTGKQKYLKKSHTYIPHEPVWNPTRTSTMRSQWPEELTQTKLLTLQCISHQHSANPPCMLALQFYFFKYLYNLEKQAIYVNSIYPTIP